MHRSGLLSVCRCFPVKVCVSELITCPEVVLHIIHFNIRSGYCLDMGIVYYWNWWSFNSSTKDILFSVTGLEDNSVE